MPSAEHRVRDPVGWRLVTREWLLRHGVSSRTLSRAVEHDLVRRVGAGLSGPADPAGAPDALAVAVQATGGVVCGPSAALLHGLDLVEAPAVHHLAVPRDSHRKPPEGRRLHRVDLRASDRVVVGGRPVTSPLRRVLDCPRWLPVQHAVVVGDSALRRGAVTAEHLAHAVARLPRGRSTSRVRRAVDLLDGRSESVLESLARVLLVLAGLPPPAVQMPLYDEEGNGVARVDLAWPEARLVVEPDGFAFHSGRRQVRRDRERGNGLTLLGWRVLRFGWEDVLGRPEIVVALVKTALGAGAT